jgi:hypothetical protein
MAAALETGDYHTLRALARKSRRERAGLGLDSLGGIGDALKDAAQRRDLAEASRQLRALTDCLNRIEMCNTRDAALSVSRA